jgi:hypothetical protein
MNVQELFGYQTPEDVAASEARLAYRAAWIRLQDEARTAMASGFEYWAEELYAFADAAWSSYASECRLSGMEPRR